MLSPVSFYNQYINNSKNALNSLKSKSAIISVIRLIVFSGMIIDTYFFFGETIFYPVLLFLIIAFAFLLKYHQKTLDLINWHKTAINIGENELKALKQDYNTFDGGKEFIDHLHPYSSDLDLFGDSSIFQILNRTVTPLGKGFLNKWIKKVDSVNDIINRQKSIKEIETQAKIINDFKTTGSITEIKKEDITNIVHWSEFNNSNLTYSIWINIIGCVTFLSTLSWSIFGGLDSLVPFLVFMGNLVLIGRKMKEFNIIQATLSKQNSSLKRTIELFNFIYKTESSGKGRLHEIKSQLNEEKAEEKINQLMKLINLFDSRLNLVIAVLLNGLFLFDNLIVIQLNKWRDNYGNKLEHWLNLMGEFDALISLANFAYNHQENQYPTISEKFQFNAKDIAHPLVNKKHRIGNDFSVNNKNELFLVTGSNMAGKSTFLRSIGVNMVLAQTGTKVVAQSFNYSPMKLYSSMRIIDSVQNGASTFFAEVDRIKSIINSAKRERIFVLLDEILKGTNSKDKYTGSKALIIQLSKYNTTGIIATHDLALGDLESIYSNIINKRFEVEIYNGDFTFDYKIKDGVCQTMNATEIMKKMGIEIVD